MTITLEQVVQDTRGALSGKVLGCTGCEARFADGVAVGKRSKSVTIALNNMWSAKGKDASRTQSYERIGYHGGSVDFLAGVFASGCPVTVIRDVQGAMTELQLEG